MVLSISIDPTLKGAGGDVIGDDQAADFVQQGQVGRARLGVPLQLAPVLQMELLPIHVFVAACVTWGRTNQCRRSDHRAAAQGDS